MRTLVSVLVLCTLSGCKDKAPAPPAEAAPAAATPAPAPAPPPEREKPKEPTAKEARVAGAKTLKAFLEAAGPRPELDAATVFTEDTDPNHLLGRPGQYAAKMNWKLGGEDATLEVFPTLEGAKARKEYVDGIGKATPIFLQYTYLNEKLFAVLRLPKELTPTKAEEWNTLLQ